MKNSEHEELMEFWHDKLYRYTATRKDGTTLKKQGYHNFIFIGEESMTK